MPLRRPAMIPRLPHDDASVGTDHVDRIPGAAIRLVRAAVEVIHQNASR